MHVLAILDHNRLSPIEYLCDGIIRSPDFLNALSAYPSVIRRMMASSPEWVREMMTSKNGKITHNYIVRHRLIFISYLSDYLSKTGDVIVDRCIRRQMGMKKMGSIIFSDCTIIIDV